MFSESENNTKHNCGFKALNILMLSLMSIPVLCAPGMAAQAPRPQGQVAMRGSHGHLLACHCLPHMASAEEQWQVGHVCLQQ